MKYFLMSFLNLLALDFNQSIIYNHSEYVHIWLCTSIFLRKRISFL